MTQTLVVTQQVPTEPGTAYTAWLTPQALATWWWVGMPDTTYEVDGRVGGSYRIVSEQAAIGVEGRYLTLRPPELIEMTWIWLDAGQPGPEEHVRVEFAPSGDGTLVTVTHTVAPDGDVGAYRQGWEYVLGNLAGPAAGPTVGPATGATRSDTHQPSDTSPGAPSVTLTQQVPAPRSEVYAAWLAPERLATWWWAGLPDTTYEVDPRPGGRFRIRSESAGIGASGSYRELIESERIVMSWTWETGSASSTEDVVTVDFGDLARHDEAAVAGEHSTTGEHATAGDQGTQASQAVLDTLVTLTHAFAAPLADTANLEEGWADVLHALAEARVAATTPRD